MSLLLALGGSGPTYTLTADSASYALSGQATGLSFNRVITADTTSFSLNGQAVSLAFNRALTADSAAYTLAGQATGLAFNRVLVADSASYALTGQAVTLTYTPLSGPTYTLTADTQSYALTGQSVGLARGWTLSAESGSYSLTGQNVTLSYSGSAYDIKVYQAFVNTDATPYDIKVYQALLDTSAVPYDIKVYQCGFDTEATVTEQNSGGYEYLSRKQTPKQRKRERQRLGIIAKDIREATQKVARAVIVETGIIHPVRHFEQHKEQFEQMLIQELRGYWSESLTDAIYAQIEAAWTRKIDQENEEIILLLM
jgi:hypothetical protein